VYCFGIHAKVAENGTNGVVAAETISQSFVSRRFWLLAFAHHFVQVMLLSFAAKDLPAVFEALNAASKLP